MKKLSVYISIFLALLLFGCEKRMLDEDSYSSESANFEASLGNFEGEFLISDFDSKSPNVLLQEYVHVIYYNDKMMENTLDTPLTLYINTGRDIVLHSYDKITGNFLLACRDPLCDHNDCLWGSAGKSIYCGNSGLFFIVRSSEGSVIYQTDFFGTDIKTLYRSNDDLSHIVQENQNIYFLEEGKDKATDELIGRIIKLNLRNLDYEILLAREELYYFMPLNESILYFNVKTTEDYRLFDPKTGVENTYASSDMLPIALYKDALYFRNGNSLCRKSNYGLGEEEVLLCDTQITDLFFNNDNVYFLNSENTIYKTDIDFTNIEEFYSAPVENRISNVIIDQNLLFYTYDKGTGISHTHFFVFTDLKTGETLEIKNNRKA